MSKAATLVDSSFRLPPSSFVRFTRMVVTIDGPAGAGKSSAARMLAKRLGYEFLDTGAMYRAVTFAALGAGIELTDQAALEKLLDTLHLELPEGRVVLNGADVTGKIRTAEITARSSAIANSPVVRRRLVDWQRRLAGGRSIVCEGRDQGTIVFPDARCKFFLVADPKERAVRRHREIQARGENIPFEQVLRDQEARDERDRVRAIAPMIAAADAVVMDSTGLSVEQVVGRMEEIVKLRDEG
jgi:cytidylate kinase